MDSKFEKIKRETAQIFHFYFDEEENKNAEKQFMRISRQLQKGQIFFSLSFSSFINWWILVGEKKGLYIRQNESKMPNKNLFNFVEKKQTRM